MYISIAVSLDIHEGMFYWYTQDSKDGPSFSQVFDLAIIFSWTPSLENFLGEPKNLENPDCELYWQFEFEIWDEVKGVAKP